MLETERLLLRLPEARDLDGYEPIFTDPDVVRFTGGQTKTRTETALAIGQMNSHWERYGVGLFSIVRREDERLIGRAGFLVWDDRWRNGLRHEVEPAETEIGWMLGREFWGRGYATEAAAAARDWGLREVGLRRLISLIQVGNDASVRVAEKLGETLEQEDVQGPFARHTDLYSLEA